MPIAEETEPEDIERVPAAEPQTVKIDMEEPDDDDGDDDEPPARAAKGSGEPKPKGDRDPKSGQWVERKKQRAADHQAAEKWATEKAALERRIAETEAATARRIAEVEARFQRGQGDGQRRTEDPHEAKLKDIEQQLAAELRLIETDDKRGYDRYNQLRRAEYEAVVDKKMAQQAATQQIARGQERHDPYAARAPIIESEYPWTMDARMAPLVKKAWAYRTNLVEFEGRPDTIDTDREALAHTVATHGAAYGLQPPARPTSAQRAGWARPGSGNVPSGRVAPRTIELPRELVDGAGLSPESLRRALAEE